MMSAGGKRSISWTLAAGVLCLALLPLGTGAAPGDALVTASDVKGLWAKFRDGSVGTDELDVSIQVSRGVLLHGVFSITSKGNGILEVPGARIRIYDTDHDGLVFEGSLLHNRLVDVDGDGFNDIVIWGTAVLSDDDDKETGRRPVLSVFHYDPRTGRFVNTVPSKHVYVF